MNLKLTKFRFDDNLIPYESLEKLLNDNGMNTKFIQKPISDGTKVHSLYISPDLEVAFLPQSDKAEEHYASAGHSCVSYREITLYDALIELGYCNISSSNKLNQTTKSKSKHITITDGDREYFIKKKKISYIHYDAKEQKVHFVVNNNSIECFCETREQYDKIKAELQS